jgi:hypothetical protein
MPVRKKRPAKGHDKNGSVTGLGPALSPEAEELERKKARLPDCPDHVLVKPIGRGAFGETWHARGPGGFDVALKFIPLNPQFAATELRSLETIKRIRHPNLVSMFGAWHKDGWIVLAMELCDGSLQDLLTACGKRGAAGFPLKPLLRFMEDAAEGLDALNERHVQHRDVKPANLLLLSSGVKVADFGLAKVLEYTVGSNTGAGTLAYMAPECFKGKLAVPSDQYSLAVTYYHLRTGRLLFQGSPAKLMYSHLELEPDLSALIAEEREVLARALAKEPGKRYPTCKALVHELVSATQKQEGEPRQEEERHRWDAQRIRQEQERLKRDAEMAAARKLEEEQRHRDAERFREEQKQLKRDAEAAAKAAQSREREGEEQQRAAQDGDGVDPLFTEEQRKAEKERQRQNVERIRLEQERVKRNGEDAAKRWQEEVRRRREAERIQLEQERLKRDAQRAARRKEEEARSAAGLSPTPPQRWIWAYLGVVLFILVVYAASFGML